MAHRPGTLAAVDLVLMMADGRAHAFGPKDEVFRRVLRPAPNPEAKAPFAPSPASAPAPTRVLQEIAR